MVGAPDIERQQALGHGAYALFIFALPLLGSALLEAAAALIAERCSRRHLVGWGLLTCAAALALCALPATSALLALGLTLAGAASGLACTAAQIELVARHPAARERAMTRWVLCGSIGDVLTPAFVALVLHLGGSYRAAFAITATWALLHGLAVLRAAPATPPAPAPASPPGLLARARAPITETREPSAGAERVADIERFPEVEPLTTAPSQSSMTTPSGSTTSSRSLPSAPTRSGSLTPTPSGSKAPRALPPSGPSTPDRSRKQRMRKMRRRRRCSRRCARA